LDNLRSSVEIRARYSEALITRVTRRFWVRLIGWHGFAAVALMSAALAYLVAAGDRSWYVSAFGTVLAVGIVVGTAVYFVCRHRAMSTFRKMADPTALFTFSESGFSSRSDLGGGDLSWRAVTQVWTFPEAWLVFVSKGTYVTIPTDSLTEVTQQFIRAKVREHGGKVV
jgi:YcxB-like protein